MHSSKVFKNTDQFPECHSSKQFKKINCLNIKIYFAINVRICQLESCIDFPMYSNESFYVLNLASNCMLGRIQLP